MCVSPPPATASRKPIVVLIRALTFTIKSSTKVRLSALPGKWHLPATVGGLTTVIIRRTGDFVSYWQLVESSGRQAKPSHAEDGEKKTKKKESYEFSVWEISVFPNFRILPAVQLLMPRQLMA